MGELWISFLAKQSITLPLSYQHILQGMLYDTLRSVDPILTNILHDAKPVHNNRYYAPFVFSRLIGQRSVKDRTAVYEGDLKMVIRSSSPALLTSWLTAFQRKQTVLLDKQALTVVNAQIKNLPAFTDKMIIRMETPIVLHKTTPDEQTVFLSPFDDDFTAYAAANTRRKWQAITQQDFPGAFAIKPIDPQPSQRCFTKFKKAHICGWYGKYELEAHPDVIQFLYNNGLGERNGQGFGLFSICRS